MGSRICKNPIIFPVPLSQKIMGFHLCVLEEFEGPFSACHFVGVFVCVCVSERDREGERLLNAMSVCSIAAVNNLRQQSQCCL